MYTMIIGKNEFLLHCYKNIKTFRTDGASKRAIRCCGWIWHHIVQKLLFEKWRIICYPFKKIAFLSKTLNVFALFMVTLLKILLCTEPILEFKLNVRHNQKRHPTFVTQVELVLQNWQEFKALVKICVKSNLSNWTHLNGILLFLQFLVSFQRFWQSQIVKEWEI